MKLSESSDVKIKVKGFKLFNDRHGKLRCYHRNSGDPIDLDKFPINSIAFLGECGRIAALYKPSATPKPGSLGLLIKEFRKSPQWGELKPKTKSFYDGAFTYLKPIWDTPLLRFNRPLVIKIRDKAYEKKGWWVANQVTTSLSSLFRWGSDRGHIEINCAAGIERIKRPKDLPRANRPWTPDERQAINLLPSHVKPIFSAMLYTGIDPCDAVALPKPKYKDGAFDLNRQKTGNPVWRPVPRALKIVIAEMPPHDAITLFANSRGKPWTKSGLDTIWERERKRLEAAGVIGKGLTLKGLRHTHATMLREQGEDHRTIADALGDKSESMGRWYSRDADTKDSMTKVTKAFDKHHKIVKPKNKSVKP